MSTNQNTQIENIIPKFQKCSVKLPYTLPCGLHRYIATLPPQKVYVEYFEVTHLYVSLKRRPRVEILVCNLTSSDCDAELKHSAFRPSFKAATMAYPVLLPTSTTASPSLDR